MNRLSYRNKDLLDIMPNNGEYIVYGILIGEMIYIGSTNNFKSRMANHQCVLNKIAENKENVKKGYYSKFDYNHIIKYGYSFYIVCTAQNLSECMFLEKTHISRTPKDKLLNLNIANCKLVMDEPNTIRPKRGRRLSNKNEKKVSINVWVKNKYINRAIKDCLKVEKKYEQLDLVSKITNT